MRLTRLQIRNFRNIEQADLSFPHTGVAIIGENGQGKTNLLEAIYYLQILRSMRGGRDQDLVRFDAPAFYLEAQVTPEIDAEANDSAEREKHTEASKPRVHTIAAAFERHGKRKKIVSDGAVLSRLSDAFGTLPSVILSPNDTELVSGAPSERRRYLDVLLSLTSRRYLTSLQAYRTALVRRNAALREATRRGTGKSDETIAVWEPALAEHGAFLITARINWILQNVEAFGELCQSIGERTPVRMRYLSTIEVPTSTSSVHDVTGLLEQIRKLLLESLERKRPLDIKRGLTHTGPHRDEMSLTLGGHSLRAFGSAGQQRTAAIALRMLEATTLREHHGSPPVLLLDDPFAELDTRRSAHILELLKGAGMGQTILAVPRSTDIPPELTSLPRWSIRSGVISVSSIEEAEH
jgi:DNA replication and repair protein RecF